MDETFVHNYLSVKEKGLLFVEQPSVFSGANPLSSPYSRFAINPNSLYNIFFHAAFR